MEEKTVLGSRVNGKWLSILFAGDTEPTFLGELSGRDVPKRGDKVNAVVVIGKNDKEYTNYYW
jgi:hypothetical protein